jgi:hypothetical protein
MTYYRVQPKGLALAGHFSGLAYEKVGGVFAVTDPRTLLGTYTWCHVSRHAADYEMVVFEGDLVAAPDDSEGVVVHPRDEGHRTPLTEWVW